VVELEYERVGHAAVDASGTQLCQHHARIPQDDLRAQAPE
jgi:hypothetical protein